jgi:hypothetical protein
MEKLSAGKFHDVALNALVMKFVGSVAKKYTYFRCRRKTAGGGLLVRCLQPTQPLSGLGMTVFRSLPMVAGSGLCNGIYAMFDFGVRVIPP